MSVYLAYCEELGRDVYIDEARIEFHGQNIHSSFSFFCSDPSCVQTYTQEGGIQKTHRTQMIATYYNLPLDEKTKITPCFRHFPGQEHNETCIWMNGGLKEPSLPEKENNESNKEKITLQESEGRIDIFYRPPTTLFKPQETAESHSEPIVTEREVTKDPTGENRQRKNLRTTYLLETLVTMYLRNQTKRDKGEITEEDFNLLSFNIKGEGDYYYRDFFRFFEDVWNNPDFNGVYMGRARLKEYGAGFKLFFNAPIQGSRDDEEKNASLYVGPEKMNEYRYRNNFRTVISRKNDMQYIKVFFMAPVFKEYRTVIAIEIPNLLNLSLQPGPPKEGRS